MAYRTSTDDADLMDTGVDCIRRRYIRASLATSREDGAARHELLTTSSLQPCRLSFRQPSKHRLERKLNPRHNQLFVSFVLVNLRVDNNDGDTTFLQSNTYLHQPKLPACCELFCGPSAGSIRPKRRGPRPESIRTSMT